MDGFISKLEEIVQVLRRPRPGEATPDAGEEDSNPDPDPEALASLVQTILDFKELSISSYNPPTNTNTSKGDAL